MTSKAEMTDWSAIRDWRRSTRTRLLEARGGLRAAEREKIAGEISRKIEEQFPQLNKAVVGLYWPIRSELDFRGLATRLIGHGATIGMPVVVDKGNPLEFWAWQPGSKLVRGFWNIPVPAERSVVHPEFLIVPLVGFDKDCYRLGYGGGYYDRTLASLDPRPMTIAVGLELGRLDTIHPQPHDIPMDVVITEKEMTFRRDEGRQTAGGDDEEDPNERGSFASPPCFMHEVAGAGLGPMSRNQTVRLLNELLEAERAGARGVTAISAGYEDDGHAVLKEIAGDEGRFCAMLARHIERLGGKPTRKTGDFYDKLVARDAGPGQLDLLNRGQRWVVRKLGEAIPLVDDDELRDDLSDMLTVHEQNIARCDALA